MKLILKKTTLFLLLAGGLLACSTTNNNEKNIKAGKEYTSEYICPMHCEGSGSDTTGTCPTCGMDYVKNPKSTQ